MYSCTKIKNTIFSIFSILSPSNIIFLSISQNYLQITLPAIPNSPPAAPRNQISYSISNRIISNFVLKFVRKLPNKSASWNKHECIANLYWYFYSRKCEVSLHVSSTWIKFLYDTCSISSSFSHSNSILKFKSSYFSRFSILINTLKIC